MAEMQEGMGKEKSVGIEDEWGKEWELLTQLFADDAHHCASGERCVQGLEERFEIATLWSAFFGMEHRATKCNAVVGRWSKSEWAEGRGWERGVAEEAVWIRGLHKGTVERVPKVEVGVDQRALGVQVNLEGYCDGALEKARVEVNVAAKAVVGLPKVMALVERCSKAVGWQTLLYRVRQLSVPEEKVRQVCKALRQAMLGRMGLPPGTATAATESFVWLSEQGEMAVERLLMVMRLLAGGGAPARAIGGAVMELQRYVGCKEPVLETKHMRCTCEGAVCSMAKQGSAGKGRCGTTCGWNGTWVGMLYRWLSNSRVTLEGGRGRPRLRQADEFLVDIVEAEEVELVREGCRAAEVWRVSEVRKLDGRGLSEAVGKGGALERLAGKGRAAKGWGEVVRRVAQCRRQERGVMGGEIRAGAASRCRALGGWVRAAVWDWRVVAWAEGGEIKLGIPQSGPGEAHLGCRLLRRVEGSLPGWMKRGPSQAGLRRQLWQATEMEERRSMVLVKEWDSNAERRRAVSGGVWPVEVSRIEAGGERSWVLDAVPGDLSEMVYLQQCELGVENEGGWRQEWGSSGWVPSVEEQVRWRGEQWAQQQDREELEEGVEEQLLGEGWGTLRGDIKWRSRVEQTERSEEWGLLDVYLDGGADAVGTPEATAEYGWVVGGTDPEALEVWAEGAARVGGLPTDMDSTRAELLGAYAVLHKVREWKGTVRLWVDNDNVVRGLQARLGEHRAEEVWEEAMVVGTEGESA